MAENKKIADVGWVSLSQSRKSLSIKVMGEAFFVPLRELYAVLEGRTSRTKVKQWIDEGEEWAAIEELKEEW